MKPIVLQFVLGLLVSSGCRTIPGQDVRYEPTPMPVVRALLELAEVGPQDLVFDLGSGDGRIPITAAKEFGARGVGIEIDPELVTLAQANAREAGVGDKVVFRLGDMYAADVRSATVVTLFLHPGPNLKLRDKLRSDLQAGSRVVSYVWDMGDWKPTEVRRVNDRRILLWRIPDRSPAQQISSRGEAPRLAWLARDSLRADVRAEWVADGQFRAQVSRVFKSSARPAAARLGSLCVFHGCLAGRTIERNDLLGRFAAQLPRVAVANPPDHLHGSNSRGLHRSSPPWARGCSAPDTPIVRSPR